VVTGWWPRPVALGPPSWAAPECIAGALRVVVGELHAIARGVVSKVLGHSNIGTTANVYAHLTPAMTQRVADRLDGVLRRPAQAG